MLKCVAVTCSRDAEQVYFGFSLCEKHLMWVLNIPPRLRSPSAVECVVQILAMAAEAVNQGYENEPQPPVALWERPIDLTLWALAQRY